ncbi:hypothetical protein E4U41_003054 [Claviceps citrina]|nr:hypothetical protein E4U41_003054 [Claviceps citrina]
MTLCHDLKHGIEDCYALLAPIDPGSTLVMSTHRNEKVKGTITRVGTRIVKGVRSRPSLHPEQDTHPEADKPSLLDKMKQKIKKTLHLQLRTQPASQITISSDPIHIPALDALHTYLTQAIDLLGLTLSSHPTASSLASALKALSECIAESRALLKGSSSSNRNRSDNNNSSSSSSNDNDNDNPKKDACDPAWQTSSCPPHHFSPPLPQNMSFYMALQDSSIVLWLRALERADAPLHFGTKLGLAIGTVRRLEHDEMDVLFRYHPGGDGRSEPRMGACRPPRSQPRPGALAPDAPPPEEVYVREKVRMESADPSLISLYSKLGQLGHMLGLARHNLAAVMGEDMDV